VDYGTFRAARAWCCAPAPPGPLCQPPAKKPKDTPRQALCRELLEIRRDNIAIFTRIEAINTKLKAIAADDDDTFRETFVDLGYVSVTPAKPARPLGEAPVLQVETWNDLGDSRRAKLIEQGLVAIEPIVKRASYGQVRVKLHAEPEGDD
jgi:hypothetical protein